MTVFSGGGKKGSAMSRSSIVTYEEAREVLDVDAYWADLEECVSNLKEDFVKHLTLRSANKNSPCFPSEM